MLEESSAVSLLDGGHNHFGRPNLPPKELGGVHYTEDGRPVTPPADFYSSDYFTDKLLQYLREGEDEDDARPFFAYLAFTAPHWPLQAPAEDIARYRGHYDAGWEALLKSRLEGQRRLGLLLCLLVGLTANALATGALSMPHHRYQARIVWLLPLAAVLLWRRPVEAVDRVSP